MVGGQDIEGNYSILKFVLGGSSPFGAIYEIVHRYGILTQIYNYDSTHYFVSGGHYLFVNNSERYRRATINSITETTTSPFYTQSCFTYEFVT